MSTWWDPIDTELADNLYCADTEEETRLALGSLACHAMVIRRAQQGRPQFGCRKLAAKCGIGKDLALKIQKDTLTRFYTHWANKRQGPPPPRKAFGAVIDSPAVDDSPEGSEAVIATLLERINALERAAAPQLAQLAAAGQTLQSQLADNSQTLDRNPADTPSPEPSPDQHDKYEIIKEGVEYIYQPDRQITDDSSTEDRLIPDAPPTLERHSKDPAPTEGARSRCSDEDRGSAHYKRPEDTRSQETTAVEGGEPPRRAPLPSPASSSVGGSEISTLWEIAWQQLGGQGAAPRQAGPGIDEAAAAKLADQLTEVCQKDILQALMAYLEADQRGQLGWPVQGTATLHTLLSSGISRWLPRRQMEREASSAGEDAFGDGDRIPDELAEELAELRADHARGERAHASPALLGWMAARPEHPDRGLFAAQLASLQELVSRSFSGRADT